MIQWEYLVTDITDFRHDELWLAEAETEKQRQERWEMTIEYELEHIGNDGWELVSATFVHTKRSFWKMIFKRPKGGSAIGIPVPPTPS